MLLHMAINLMPKEVMMAYDLLHGTEKRRIKLLMSIQMLLSFLDLVGIFILGLLISATISDNSTGKSRQWLDQLIHIFRLTSQSYDVQLLLIAGLSIFLLLLKTALSILFTKNVFVFFSNFSANLSGRLIRNILNSKISKFRSFTTQEIAYSSTRGVEIIALDILANLVVIVADGFFLLIIICALVYINFTTALSVIVMFALVGFVLFYSLQRYTFKLGVEITELSLESNEKILEAFSSPRENHVKNNQNFYADKILSLRKKVAKTMVGVYFVPYLGKYLIEVSIILGSVAYGVIQSLNSSAGNFADTFALFIVAATRAAPSALRIQQGLLQIKGAIGKSLSTLKMIEIFDATAYPAEIKANLVICSEEFSPSISINDVSYSYPMQEIPAIRNFSLTIESGTTVAIVGPSGSGKSTLVDCILGILDPDQGEILISGKSPDDAIVLWPGKIAYVPQDTYIINDTLKENIIIGTSEIEQAKRSISSTIKSVLLTDFVDSLPDGLNTILGERGSRISGGQKQRVGIARAIYSNPSLIVLDEATSALDQNTEKELSASLYGLKGKLTLLVIAHRMTTVLAADLVVYLENGEIKAVGTLQEVKNAVPEFRLAIDSLGNSNRNRESG